jgi:ribosome-associated protein
MIHVTETVALDEHEIQERFVRAMGPRSQNLNRDATAVELRLDVARSSLPRDVKKRLIALGGRHVTSDGVLVVVGRLDRSQVRNRAAAHARLFALVERAAKPPRPRKATQISPAARQKRMVAKERQSAVKRSRVRQGED